MDEKFEKACSEIIQNEVETKKFIKLNTPEEMYNYFKEKIPGISEEEFDNFIVEVLETYEKEQETIKSIDPNSLNDIAGGISLKSKILSGALAFMSAFSPMISATNTSKSESPSVQTTATQNLNKQNLLKSQTSNKFSKFTNWVKKHPIISAGVTLAVVVGSVFAVKKIVDSKKSNKSLGAVSRTLNNTTITNHTGRIKSIKTDLRQEENTQIREKLSTFVEKDVPDYSSVKTDIPDSDFAGVINVIREATKQFNEAEKLYKKFMSYPDHEKTFEASKITALYKQAKDKYEALLNNSDQELIRFAGTNRDVNEFIPNQARQAKAAAIDLIEQMKKDTKQRKGGKSNVPPQMTTEKLYELEKLLDKAIKFAKKSGDANLISECETTSADAQTAWEKFHKLFPQIT